MMSRVTLKIIHDTFFKQDPVQSTLLKENAKIVLESDQALNCLSLHSEEEHYRVELEEAIAPWGVEGFLYEGHVEIISSLASNRLVSMLLSEQYDLLLNEAKTLVGGETNTCTAFASSVLREFGIQVPIKDIQLNEEVINISLITRAFSDWLMENVNCERILDYKSLQSGDICFTRDNKKFPGFPAHVYFFLGYYLDDTGAAYIVDNQGQNHPRNLDEDRPHKTPFGYALRLPALN
jgi:hypothetical protein